MFLKCQIVLQKCKYWCLQTTNLVPNVFILIMKLSISIQKVSRLNYNGVSPLHPIIYVGPFCKWGIDFMECLSMGFEMRK